MPSRPTTIFLAIALTVGGAGCAGSGASRPAFAAQTASARGFMREVPRRGPADTAALALAARELNAPTPARTFIVEQPPSPPPPPSERVPARPAREAVWVAGYYAYLGDGRYEWVPGQWEVPPHTDGRFERPRWERRGNGFVYIGAGWR